jgi:hypothetical protein
MVSAVRPALQRAPGGSHQRRALQHSGLPELEQQLVPLARAFADTCKDGNSRMPLDRRSDQLHDEHGLADAGAAEHRRLATLHERRQQVDHLDPSVKDLERSTETVESGRCGMDGAALDVGRKRWPAVGGLTKRIEEPPKHSLTNRHSDGRTQATRDRASAEAGRIFERHRAYGNGVEMLLDLRDDGTAAVPLDREGFVDGRQGARREPYIDYGAMYRDDMAGSARVPSWRSGCHCWSPPVDAKPSRSRTVHARSRFDHLGSSTEGRPPPVSRPEIGRNQRNNAGSSGVHSCWIPGRQRLRRDR